MEITAKYVGGLYAEDECMRCIKIGHIQYMMQDEYARIIAQYCAACSLHKNLYDGKKIETNHETTLI